jgi:hypothetical protein
MPKSEKKFFVRYLPMYGCISTGIIYLGIGIIAILSFLKIKQGGADESSMMEFLDDYLLGKIGIWIILLGSVCYIIWRIYETVNDPYDYGKEWKGLGIRSGIALSTIADAFIVFSAIQVLLGTGNIQEDGDPEEQRQLVAGILQENWGEWVIISIGIIISFTAIIQFIYGITQGYKERLDIAHFSQWKKKIVHVLAWAGYFARGIILGIIGFFFIKAGILEDAEWVVNTDKAFDFIGDQVGHFYFILVALGTILYGIFMFVLGITYDTD